MSVADELAKLNQLRQSGALSEAEFAAAKTRVLEEAGSDSVPTPGTEPGPKGPSDKRRRRGFPLRGWLLASVALAGVIGVVMCDRSMRLAQERWEVYQRAYPVWEELSEVADAVYLCRDRSGQFPGRLDDVVAAGLLAGVPADVFSPTGQPLRYHLGSRYFFIWSVGPDGMDDTSAVLSRLDSLPANEESSRQVREETLFNATDYHVGDGSDRGDIRAQCPLVRTPLYVPDAVLDALTNP